MHWFAMSPPSLLRDRHLGGGGFWHGLACGHFFSPGSSVRCKSRTYAGCMGEALFYGPEQDRAAQCLEAALRMLPFVPLLEAL